MRSLSTALITLLATSSQKCCQGFVAPSHNSHITTTIPSTQLKKQPLSILSVATATEINAVGTPGTADLPWSELGFGFRPTKSHLRMTYRDGKWQEPELVASPYISLHIGATARHYGQACFEGLKAFAHEDGSVHLFRPDENAKRINKSASRVMMPEIPVETFIKACNDVVKDNIAYVPPYGSGGALYLRPLLFGSGPRIGLQPSDEYTFIVMVIPVSGSYYKGGLAQPLNGLIVDEYDRAAPKGVGAVKVAGNYAADLIPNMGAKKEGFPICLYLDAATHTLVEEFSTSNFIGIDNENKKYVTPKSDSVLPSITNKCLQTIAKDECMTVEQRAIEVSELPTFDEVIACGTAVVVTPIGSLTRFDDNGIESKYQFTEDVGETTRRLYNKVRNIQNGEIEDTHNWNFKVE
jgi:branched-chain amino acid aminotransferase